MHAQVCDSRELTNFVAASTSYAISGSATLEKMEDGSLELKFNADFDASSGPNLYVYLATQNAAPTSTGNTSYEVSTLTSNTAAQTYNIPNTVDFEAYDYVLVHCKQFNAFWGGGLLSTGSGGCNNTATSTTNIELDKSWDFYPNPANNQVNIELANEGNLSIINNLGQTIWTKENSQVFEQIDLSSFQAGSYFLQYLSDQQKSTKRLIIE